MPGKNTAAFGIYPNKVALEEGLVALREANFRPEDVSILYPDNEGTKDFGHEKATKAPEGASAGASTGAVIGGVLGSLAGIGAIAVPGIGPFIAAGPILAALAGVGAGGVVGGITGSLIGFGIPEYEAKRYESDTKAELKKAGFWSRCIATTRTGLTKPKLFYRKPAPRTYPQPERPALILLRAINRCHAGGCVVNW